MSERMQAILHYRYGESRILSDGRIETEALPYAVWSCACGENITSYNLFNGLFYTHCTCGRPYSIDWRHGITPRVLLISEDIQGLIREQI